MWRALRSPDPLLPPRAPPFMLLPTPDVWCCCLPIGLLPSRPPPPLTRTAHKSTSVTQQHYLHKPRQKQTNGPQRDKWVKMWYAHPVRYCPDTKRKGLSHLQRGWAWEYCTQWNKSKTDTTQSHLYVESKKRREKHSQKQRGRGLPFSGSPVVKTALPCRVESSTPGQGV